MVVTISQLLNDSRFQNMGFLLFPVQVPDQKSQGEGFYCGTDLGALKLA
jgi:hypothetical protein